MRSELSTHIASSKKQYERYSMTPAGKNVWQGDYALYPFIDRINQAGVPIYMTNGWYDLFTGEMFLWYANLSVPRRLIVRPLDHSEVEGNGFDLLPASYQFQKGSRIRITIAFADAGNFDTPILDPAPALKLLRDPDYQSFVELPVIERP